MCVCVRARTPAIALSIGTKYANKEEIVSGTPSEDSGTLRLSSLRAFTRTMYSKLCFTVFEFLFVKKIRAFIET